MVSATCVRQRVSFRQTEPLPYQTFIASAMNPRRLRRTASSFHRPLNQSNVDPLVSPTHTSAMQENHGPNMAAPRVSFPVEPRREKRLHIAVPVKIFLDPERANFQLSCTSE